MYSNNNYRRTTMLHTTFIELVSKYSNNNNLIENLWNEIKENYSSKHRYYHTLTHLDNLLLQLAEIKSHITDWDTILFTLYYHDLVYNPQRSDNEEQSAEIAAERMKQLSVPEAMIEQCRIQILATKTHNADGNTDTNYFTDADLSILGQDTETYMVYSKNIRQEYSIYPDSVYNPGRTKVIEHFLAMKRIYKTEHFYTNLEQQARANLYSELALLNEI